MTNEKGDDEYASLKLAIQANSKGRLDSLLSNLESKYAEPEKKAKKVLLFNKAQEKGSCNYAYR
jgi:hypothetical protein